jgi:hypothetical protein
LDRALDHYRYDQVGNLHLAEYMVELAHAYQASDRRAVRVQEVGTSSEWMPETYISQYATTLLENAAACQNLWGFTWWCSHDIDPAMKGFLTWSIRWESSISRTESSRREKHCPRSPNNGARIRRRRFPAPQRW